MTEAARFLVDEALAALGRVVEAWPWLADVRVPGRGPVLERRMDPREEPRVGEAHRRDRAAALAAARRGLTGAGPHADAARVAPVAARAFVAHELRLLLERLAGEGAVFAVLDPASRRLTARCRWCHGSRVVGMPTGWAWDWPADPPECPLCLGTGEVPAAVRCVACGSVTVCDCDHADAVVSQAAPLLRKQIRAIVDDETAGDALRVVERCDRAARRAAGVAEDRRVIKAPCPACGRHELYAEVSSVDRSAWVVRCGYYGCACAGPACGCGRPVRWPGRRHLWPAREWDGPSGLARLLGVPLPGANVREAS